MFELNMTLPPNTCAKYKVEVAMPFNGSAQMDICNINVRFIGFNCPCLKVPTVEYQSQVGTIVLRSIIYNIPFA